MQKLGTNLKKPGSNSPKNEIIRSSSQLDETIDENQGPGSLVLPHFRSNPIGPHDNFWCVSSSRLPDTSFAYKYCKVWPETGTESCRLGFSLLWCRLVWFFFSFLLYFNFIFDSCIRAELILEGERDIDVIESDNLWKCDSFLLYCNLLHLLHDV